MATSPVHGPLWLSMRGCLSPLVPKGAERDTFMKVVCLCRHMLLITLDEWVAEDGKSESSK